jgi:8-oxo-dGTP pyrophosphatase MutT (NUDIX family)
MADTRAPRNASTVIVARPNRDRGFELCMTRRPGQMKFLGGYYVFPGGKVTRHDTSRKMLQRLHGVSPDSARSALDGQLSPERCLAHWVAGIRELFEEVGILLCVTDKGEPANLRGEAKMRRLARKRAALVAGAIDFTELLESEGLYGDGGRLVYFSHRITPEGYSMRFDTRFFLAKMPVDQRPLSSSEEVAETLWTTPERALAEHNQGKLPVIPPTLAALTTLRECASWDSLVDRYQLK